MIFLLYRFIVRYILCMFLYMIVFSSYCYAETSHHRQSLPGSAETTSGDFGNLRYMPPQTTTTMKSLMTIEQWQALNDAQTQRSSIITVNNQSGQQVQRANKPYKNPSRISIVESATGIHHHVAPSHPTRTFGDTLSRRTEHDVRRDSL